MIADIAYHNEAVIYDILFKASAKVSFPMVTVSCPWPA
jgi:hypothetical protein